MVRTSPSGSGSGDNTSDSRGSFGGGYSGGSFGDSTESDDIGGGGSSGNDGGGDPGGASSGGAPEDDNDGGGFPGSGDSDPAPAPDPDPTPTRSITRRSTVTESVFDSSGGTLGNEVDPALGDPNVSSSSVPRQVETTGVDPTSTASSTGVDLDLDSSTTRSAVAGAALAGVAAPEPVSSGAGAAVLGGLAAGAIVADTVRQSELDPSEFNPDIPELQPGQRQQNELEPGQRQQNELDAPANDQIGQSELGIGEQLNQPEITIGESTGGSTGTRPADETVVPADFPLPGRDVPADPSQEFIDRSPDPSDVVSGSTSTAVDSGGATVDRPSSPTINDGFDSPTISDEDEPGFETPREFPTGGGSSRIDYDETVDPEVGTGTQTTEITESFSPTVEAGGSDLGPGGRRFGPDDPFRQPEPEIDPGIGSGINSGTSPGVNPGTNPGINPGTDPGVNPGVNPGTETGPGTGRDITPERQEMAIISAQAAVDSGNQLANRTPQQSVQRQQQQLAEQLSNPSLGQGQQFDTSFNFNVPNRFRPRLPDDEDDDEEPDFLSTETDSSLFDSGISSGEEIADQLFGSSR